jgi:hypothetical protein
VTLLMVLLCVFLCKCMSGRLPAAGDCVRAFVPCIFSSFRLETSSSESVHRRTGMVCNWQGPYSVYRRDAEIA